MPPKFFLEVCARLWGEHAGKVKELLHPYTTGYAGGEDVREYAPVPRAPSSAAPDPAKMEKTAEGAGGVLDSGAHGNRGKTCHFALLSLDETPACKRKCFQMRDEEEAAQRRGGLIVLPHLLGCETAFLTHHVSASLNWVQSTCQAQAAKCVMHASYKRGKEEWLLVKTTHV